MKNFRIPLTEKQKRLAIKLGIGIVESESYLNLNNTSEEERELLLRISDDLVRRKRPSVDVDDVDDVDDADDAFVGDVDDDDILAQLRRGNNEDSADSANTKDSADTKARESSKFYFNIDTDVINTLGANTLQRAAAKIIRVNIKHCFNIGYNVTRKILYFVLLECGYFHPSQVQKVVNTLVRKGFLVVDEHKQNLYENLTPELYEELNRTDDLPTASIKKAIAKGESEVDHKYFKYDKIPSESLDMKRVNYQIEHGGYNKNGLFYRDTSLPSGYFAKKKKK